jgi:hypothetical protein
MTRSPDSLIPSGAGQPALEKRDDKASKSRQGGEANLWAATKVNVVSASLPPPAIKPIELGRLAHSDGSAAPRLSELTAEAGGNPLGRALLQLLQQGTGGLAQTLALWGLRSREATPLCRLLPVHLGRQPPTTANHIRAR